MNKQSLIAGLISFAYVFVVPVFITLSGLELINTILEPDGGWRIGDSLIILLLVFGLVLWLVTAIMGLILARKPLKKRGIGKPVIAQIASWLTTGFVATYIIIPMSIIVLGYGSNAYIPPSEAVKRVLLWMALTLTIYTAVYVSYFLLYTRVFRASLSK